MPLSGKRLCEAEITTPGTSSCAAAHATAGVGTTPSVCTSTPSPARPDASAASSNGPEMRVSRPMTTRSPPRTRAVARPSATTSSGVRSRLATPRTPSVPNRRVTAAPLLAVPPNQICFVRTARTSCALALRVLRSLPGLLEAVLLRLLLASVTREEARLLERGADLLVELRQGAGDAEPQRAGLAGRAAAVDRRVHVVHVSHLAHAQRLAEQLAVRRVGEVVGDIAAVDGDLALARTQPDTGDGRLAPAGRDDERRVLDGGGGLRQRGSSQERRACSMRSGCGCWAVWGWFGPVYTLSFFSIWRPSRFFGSMPRTDLRTASAGLTSSRLAYVC